MIGFFYTLMIILGCVWQSHGAATFDISQLEPDQHTVHLVRLPQGILEPEVGAIEPVSNPLLNWQVIFSISGTTISQETRLLESDILDQICREYSGPSFIGPNQEGGVVQQQALYFDAHAPIVIGYEDSSSWLRAIRIHPGNHGAPFSCSLVGALQFDPPRTEGPYFVVGAESLEFIIRGPSQE